MTAITVLCDELRGRGGWRDGDGTRKDDLAAGVGWERAGGRRDVPVELLDEFRGASLGFLGLFARFGVLRTDVLARDLAGGPPWGAEARGLAGTARFGAAVRAVLERREVVLRARAVISVVLRVLLLLLLLVVRRLLVREIVARHPRNGRSQAA